MKGLAIRLAMVIAIFLWAWDIVHSWQSFVQKDESRHTQIQRNGVLQVGLIEHPIAYFVGAQGNSGIEYEMTRQFADYLGLKHQVNRFENSEQLLNALKKGEIDIAAAGLLFQPNLSEQFLFGASYYSASWQVVYKKGGNRPYKIEDINQPLVIPNGSNALPLLQRMQADNPDLMWQFADNVTQEELLFQVAEGKIPYTVAMSVDVSAAQQIKPDLAVGFDLSDEMPVVWYLKPEMHSELQALLLEFMNHSLENGLISRMEEKYFNHLSRFDYVDSRSFIKAVSTVLPKYKPLFEKYRGDLSWEMLAAIAYQESHWDPNATSPTGVRGMMMLTRDTAERVKVSDRTHPEQSIRGGSEYLHWLITQMPETIPAEDRIWFALAGYNMGLGHLLDVRRLTKQLGGNPDNWLDVKKNLPLLAEKRHYGKLKYGYARGFEAYNYVENIRRYHNMLNNHNRVEEMKQQLEETKQQEDIKQPTENQNEQTGNTATDSEPSPQPQPQQEKTE